MRSPRCALLLVAALAACATKEARRADTTSPATATLAGAPATGVDAAVVRRAVQVTDSQFTAAVLKGDSTGIAATYSDDAIFMPPNMKVARGRAAITSSFGGMIAVEKATAFSLSSQDLIVSGDYGIQTGSYDLTVQLKTGKSMHDVGKFLAVYQRQPDGSYKMIRDIFNSDSPPPK